MKTSALTQKQLELLSCIYKYRFSSRQLLAETLHTKEGMALHRRLKTLVASGLIAERYDKRLNLLGKPIAYYLTPKGLRELKSQSTIEITDSIMRQSYKDRSSSQAFIDHNMMIHSISNTLQRQYPGLRAFTKREMAVYDYFPKTPPDAFFSMPQDDEEPLRFFLDIVTAYEQRYQFEQQLNQLSEYFEAEEWDLVSDTLPTLLFVAETPNIERRVQTWAHRMLTNKYDLDIKVLSTSIQKLCSDALTKVWSTMDADDNTLDSY